MLRIRIWVCVDCRDFSLCLFNAPRSDEEIKVRSRMTTECTVLDRWRSESSEFQRFFLVGYATTCPLRDPLWDPGPPRLRSRAVDMNCPTARQCACGMRPDSESRSGVADGVVDQSGRPIRPVDAETGSAALPQSGLGLLSGKHPSGRASRGSCMGCGTADGSFPPPATTGPSGEAMMLMSDSTSSLAQGRRVVRCFFDLGVMVSAGASNDALCGFGGDVPGRKRSSPARGSGILLGHSDDWPRCSEWVLVKLIVLVCASSSFSESESSREVGFALHSVFSDIARWSCKSSFISIASWREAGILDRDSCAWTTLLMSCRCKKNAFCKAISTVLISQEKTYITLCPTNLAALIAGGITLHKFSSNLK